MLGLYKSVTYNYITVLLYLLSTVDEAWKSMTDWFQERVSSPILSTFTIAWLISNYRFVIVLISDYGYEVKFDFFEEYFNKDVYFQHVVIFPLLTSLTYLWLYPFVRNLVYKRWSRFQAELEDIKIANFKSKNLSEEEIDKLKISYVELQNKYKQDIDERNEVINILKKENLNFSNEISSINIKKSNESKKISPYLKIVLTYLTTEPSLSVTELYERVGTYFSEYDEFKNVLTEAVSMNYINSFYDKNFAENQLSLTNEGRFFLERAREE